MLRFGGPIFIIFLILSSVLSIWRIIEGTELQQRPFQPTLITLDLLQVAAFLVAWSTLVGAITAKALEHIHNTREVDRSISEHRSQLDEFEAKMDRTGELTAMCTKLQEENASLKEKLRQYEEEP